MERIEDVVCGLWFVVDVVQSPEDFQRVAVSGEDEDHEDNIAPVRTMDGLLQTSTSRVLTFCWRTLVQNGGCWLLAVGWWLRVIFYLVCTMAYIIFLINYRINLKKRPASFTTHLWMTNLVE